VSVEGPCNHSIRSFLMGALMVGSVLIGSRLAVTVITTETEMRGEEHAALTGGTNLRE
jgi:hypothetical protein